VNAVRYNWVLFDADGTLFDYDRAEAQALRATFADAGHPFEPGHAEVYRQVNGALWRAFERGEIAQAVLKVRRFEQLLAAVGMEADAAAFSRRYLENLGLAADLVPGAERVVRALHGRVGLVLITNGLKQVQRSRFARSPIGGCFAEVVISEEVGAAKPDARIFDAAFERMGCPPKKEVLIVGDSLTSDMRGGNDYGIDTCWFNPSQAPRPDGVEVCYEIHDLDEVLAIVNLSHLLVSEKPCTISS
jgi:2-haloacid dehalogenase